MTDPQLERARYFMIEQQIRPWDVLDQRILDLLAATPREDYVPEAHRGLAFVDTQIPLGHGERMMPPRLEGRLLQTLAPQPGEKALEIGTGSGYLTACLAQLAGRVESVDIHADFVESARTKLEAHGHTNVNLSVGDAAHGWGANGSYDVIAITGSLPVYIDAFERQLRIGGRLFVVVGSSPAMEAMLITRIGEDVCIRESLFETDLPALVNAARPTPFTL